jgi:glycosyltransferase involved in cell wall biosynthesis
MNRNKKISWCVSVKNRCKPVWKHKNTNRVIELQLFAKCMLSLVDQQHEDEHWEICIADFMSTDVPCVEKYVKDIVSKSKGVIDVNIVTITNNFNRGMGRNRAYQLSNFDNIFFLDADMLITERSFVDNIYTIIENNIAWFPICRSFVDKQHTKWWWRTTGTGNVGMSRELFNTKPGGWLEKEAWGKEDGLFYTYFKPKSKRAGADGLYHQWHPADTPIKQVLDDSTNWVLQT